MRFCGMIVNFKCIFFLNEQLVNIHMILYFVCKVIRCFIQHFCSSLLYNTHITCYIYRILLMTYLQIWLHFIFRDTSKFNRFFCLYIFTRFKQRISSELIDMHMVHLQIFEKTVTVHFACSWGFRHLKHCPINMFKDTFCLWKQ